jgi:hypothetical protein
MKAQQELLGFFLLYVSASLPITKENKIEVQFSGLWTVSR